jgi:NAD(P)H-dependent FMN reductase
MPQKRIIAISGSLRPNSSNTSLLRALGNFVPDSIQYTLYQGLDKLPFFSPELADNAPASVSELRALIKNADGVIICTPEYAFGMPGVLKNALDWIVSSGELVDKPVVTVSASPSPMGGEKAHASLRLTLSALSANLIEGGSLTVPAIRVKMDAEGIVTDEGLRNELKNLSSLLVKVIA